MKVYEEVIVIRTSPLCVSEQSTQLPLYLFRFLDTHLWSSYKSFENGSDKDSMFLFGFKFVKNPKVSNRVPGMYVYMLEPVMAKVGRVLATTPAIINI